MLESFEADSFKTNMESTFQTLSFHNKKLHNDKKYDRCLGLFFVCLQKSMPTVLIVVNRQNKDNANKFANQERRLNSALVWVEPYVSKFKSYHITSLTLI